MLRLMGLPPPSRFPRATVSLGEDVVVLRFGGAHEQRVLGIPLWTVAGDAERATLLLLARLAEIGFDVRMA